jgi:type IV secretory pathway VirB10-like protein
LGAAALITLLESGSNALAQRFQRGTSVTISPQATTNVAGELLKDTLAQPPTIHVATGAIITVLATKDIDFSGVYTLDEKGRP